MSVLREKMQEINKLKDKLSEYEEEIERWKGLYEGQAIREKELRKNVGNKYQMSRTQIDARQKALDILEKSSQLDELDQAYKDQKSQLSSMMEKLDELTKQRCHFEEEEQKLKQQTSKLETENKTLKCQLNDIITEVTQKSVELSKVQKCLEIREKELNDLQESYNNLKTQTSTDVVEKDNKIKNLENRIAKGESSHSDLANSEDDWMGDCLKEGRDKSSEINALATLVGSLNEKLERKDKELTSCKLVAEETMDELKQKIRNLESNLEKYQNEERSNDQLDALKQRNSYLEKELENVRGQLTSAKRSKETRPTWRRSNDTKTEERSRNTEKEFRQKEARYESQLADLQEERDQLQSELLIKDDECAQVSLCLDEALKNTNDLKQQIKTLELELGEKVNVGGLRIKSGEVQGMTGSVEIMEALRRELEQSREHNKHVDDELQERNDTISGLRNEVRQKDDELKRYRTKLVQFEENNKLADRKRMIDVTSNRNDYHHTTKDSYKNSFSHKTRLKELDDQLKLREDLERISLEENESLRRQINEKDLRIKTLQQKLVDLKKAFQRELKSSSVDCLEINGTTEKYNVKTGLLVSSSTQTDNEELEYLDMNFKYLKHVIIKYMCSTNEKSRQMLPIVGHLLRLSPKELDLIKDTFEWKLPLD
ncbi:golgin subfamily A member 1-like isoform X2 [Dendronephthya gigantea]|nr:golgin subfamily A member 1-like isoform X2 [Dendronephthya gigantea]